MAYDLLDRALLVADQLEEETDGDAGATPDTGTAEEAGDPDEELEEEDEDEGVVG